MTTSLHGAGNMSNAATSSSVASEVEARNWDKVAKDRAFRQSLRRYFRANDSMMVQYGTPGFLKNMRAAISLATATIRMMKRLDLPDTVSGDFTDWLNHHDVELDEMLKRFPDPWWMFWH